MGAVINPQQQGVGVIEGEAWPLVPTGVYSVSFVRHETGVAFGAPRVYLHFKIVTPGKFFGTVLYRAYRVRCINGKPRRGGAFKVSLRGEYVRELVLLLDLRTRRDRISPRILLDKVLRVQVEEVIRDHKQREIPSALRYSIIRKLICVEAGT